jgi:hypothetical protein
MRSANGFVVPDTDIWMFLSPFHLATHLQFVKLLTMHQMICLRIEFLTAVVMKSPIVWDITPYSPLKFSACYLLLVCCLAYSSTLKCSSGTSVDFQWATRRCIEEDIILKSFVALNLRVGLCRLRIAEIAQSV